MDTELNADDLKALVGKYEEIYKKRWAKIPAGCKRAASGIRYGSVPLVG